MKSFLQYIFSSLSFFWRSNLAVMIGVAISTMVLTGTLIVGDSIRSSLEETTLLRLGETEFVFSGHDRYFRASLTEDLAERLDVKMAPFLQLNGIASTQGGAYKLNRVQVIGLDEHFSSFIPGSTISLQPSENEVFISENVAQRLQLKVGDSFLLRIEKASQIPKNAPFVAESDNYIS
ncbi:MAG: ABC transporter permease, partial [Saprospiraceae bacterium]|nr:ABC transporter permease [Saprospiraceae bacterium]